MALNLITSLLLSTTVKQNEFIFPKALELSTNSVETVSTTMFIALVSLRPGRWGLGTWNWGSLCVDWVIRQLFEWLPFNAVTHALVSTAHTETISVGLCCQASVKQPVAFTAAVEHLFAHIFLLWFVFASRWQHNGWRITTQHWEILIAEIFVLVLQNKKKRKNINGSIFLKSTQRCLLYHENFFPYYETAKHFKIDTVSSLAGKNQNVCVSR